MPVQVARRPLSSDWLLEDEDSGISSVSQRTHVDARFCSNSAYSYWLVLAQAEKLMQRSKRESFSGSGFPFD